VPPVWLGYSGWRSTEREDHNARTRKGGKEKSIVAGSVLRCLVRKEKLEAHNLTAR
jgi:hypothetical protein